MDFRLDDEQLAFRDAICMLCDQHFDLAAVASREGAPVADSAWNALSDMGVFAMLVPGEPGGAVEAALAFEQLGAHVASGPYRWSTIAAPLLADAATGARRVSGVVVDPVATHQVVEHATESDTIVVLHTDRIEQCVIAAFDHATGSAPLDPLTPASAFTSVPPGSRVGDAIAAARMLVAGTILTAAELVGAAQGSLDVARAYALERHQFGVPIGSFQAIKHLLADMYVRVELARSATYAAAAIFDNPRAGDATTAASGAKLLAGDAGIANGKAAVQVLGGMGFTWEMLPHYFLKRAWLLEESFGTSDDHALALSTASVAAWT
jgi:alkylation response protein AidB-like acyl-CoA dehydrogenase